MICNWIPSVIQRRATQLSTTCSSHKSCKNLSPGIKQGNCWNKPRRIHKPQLRTEPFTCNTRLSIDFNGCPLMSINTCSHKRRSRERGRRPCLLGRSRSQLLTPETPGHFPAPSPREPRAHPAAAARNAAFPAALPRSQHPGRPPRARKAPFPSRQARAGPEGQRLPWGGVRERDRDKGETPEANRPSPR